MSFVGRTDELRRLRAALQAAEGGGGSLVFLTGEAGIGKTRTATELIRSARAAGAIVLAGCCPESEGTLSYWPWMQILRAGLGLTRTTELTRQLGPSAYALADLLPELRAGLAAGGGRSTLDPVQARFQLFDAASRFLRWVASRAPLLLFLDDLQWADAGALALLDFVARDISDAPILIVATYRDGEARDGSARATAIAALLRQPACQRIALHGLSREEVAELLALFHDADRPASPLLLDEIVRVTQGNPLFVQETVRHLLDEHGPAAVSAPGGAARGLRIPDTVREVIRRRIQRISEACLYCLRLAAIVGQVFPARLLGHLIGDKQVATRDVPRWLDEAETARLVDAVAGEIGTYSFVHPLVREVLYEDTPRSQRAAVHLRIAQAIEALHGADTTLRAAELAHHYFLAAPGTGVAKAVQYNRIAGEQAVARHALEEAVQYYERALRAFEVEPQSARARCELMLQLGVARALSAGHAAAEKVLLDAMALARQLPDADLFAEATLAYTGIWGTTGLSEERFIAPL